MPGLYRGLLDLKASLEQLARAAADDAAPSAERCSMLIQAQAAALDLAEAEPRVDGRRADERASRSSARQILELEYTLDPARAARGRASRPRTPSAPTSCMAHGRGGVRDATPHADRASMPIVDGGDTERR